MKYLKIILILILLIIGTEYIGRIYIKYEVQKISGINFDNKTYGILISDNELGFVHRSNSYNRNRISNNFGFLNFKDVKLPQKRDKNDKVLISYGGSTTYGYNINQKETWPYLLNKKICDLNSSEEICNDLVLNAGHIMWSIGHIYIKAKRDIPIIKPDYIIIYSGINEYSNYLHLKKNSKKDIDKMIENQNYGTVTQAYNWWFIRYNSIFLKILNYYGINPLKRIIQKYSNIDEQEIYKIAEKDYDKIYKNYIEVLKKIITFSNKNGAKVIYVSQISGIDTKKNIFLTSFSQKATKEVKSLGVTVIDSMDLIKTYDENKAELFSDSGVHFSKYGSELFADFLIQSISKLSDFITIPLLMDQHNHN